MNIPLSILIEAVECMSLLREFEFCATTPQATDEYMRCLSSYSDLKAHVLGMTKTLSAEVMV